MELSPAAAMELTTVLPLSRAALRRFSSALAMASSRSSLI